MIFRRDEDDRALREVGKTSGVGGYRWAILWTGDGWVMFLSMAKGSFCLVSPPSYVYPFYNSLRSILKMVVI